MAKSEPPAGEYQRLDALLAQVRERTREHGQQAALAAALGIAPRRVSEYLAEPPVRRPNGEMTIALLEWLGALKGRK